MNKEIALHHSPEQMVSFCQTMLQMARDTQDDESIAYVEDICTIVSIVAEASSQRAPEPAEAETRQAPAKSPANKMMN